MKRYSRLLLLSCLIMRIVALDAPARADPIQISGGLISATGVGGVQTYKGIPYAKPPVGDLRWRPPQPIVPWSGTLIADEFSPICVQPDPLGGHSIFTRLFFTPIEPRSEDCLYLNVWTTAQAGDRRPVMVWIPGGGFVGGSSAGKIYDGAELAKKGVVLVSINYRVWKFGFLAMPELSQESEHHVSGNYGCWVNFAATGDPNGPGLPEWPAFDPKTDSVLYLDKTIERGPIPNQKYYAFWDAFAAGWKGQK